MDTPARFGFDVKCSVEARACENLNVVELPQSKGEDKCDAVGKLYSGSVWDQCELGIFITSVLRRFQARECALDAGEAHEFCREASRGVKVGKPDASGWSVAFEVGGFRLLLGLVFVRFLMAMS